MKSICLFALFVCLGYNLVAQSTNKLPEHEVTLYGWVNAMILHDSRQSVSAIDNLYTLFPLPINPDSNGNDLNAEGSTQFSTIITRLGTTFTMPDIANGTLGARIEVDFSGGTVTNGIRFRHAYVTWEKKNSQILFGRTWHPMFVERCFPLTQNIGIGVPFQTFNRCPQFRWTQKLNKLFTFQGTAAYQGPYKSIGPDGATPRYQRDSEIPNLHAKLFLQNKHLLLGAGADYKAIKPRRSTTSASGDEYVANELVHSNSVYAFMKLTNKSFHLKTRYMLGENNTDHLQPGGFGVIEYDPVTGAEKYTVSRHSSAYADLQFGTKVKFGIFLGYMKNHGFKDDLYISETGDAVLFGRTMDVDEAYRISPRVEYKVKNFSVGLEYENNTACYGTVNAQERGIVDDATAVTNHRFMCSVYYFFNKKL